MRIVVLAGGFGGSRFVSGVRDAVGPDDEITVVANTADDIWLFGLRVSPDLDTIMYTLGDGIDAERGWGRTDETWNAKEELATYGEPQAWFGLGDRDLATHVVRTARLREGLTLTEATAELCRRWQPGVTLLPMTDAQVETHVATTVDGQDQVIHFQEYWIKHHAGVPVRGIELQGIEDAGPTPEVLAALESADVILAAPSNPIVSIGPIVSVPGMRDALSDAKAPVVGVSPIIGGAALRGMADQLLDALGIEISATGVARYHGDLLDGWLVDTEDADQVDAIEAAGITARAVPLYMRDAETSRQLALDAIALATELHS
ncbi:2-phospho-L-lactate transferase [Aeromicrobium terrae]|uniref:2-phospho-L-lactate transferase n=1 Tax=Aeromicrobium terrae TaxID=2498846 RepID=A0A5C8NIJ7_9ACTN|nr:2-phospho-L-lactate transferase [Aeromicrobium terrae]TXL60685.1 2-phospho-L-lactate transferase [Aeromicrobium terrae]